MKDLRKQVEKLQEENLNLRFQISSLAQPQPTSRDNLDCQTMQTKVAPTFDSPRPELVSYNYLCHNYPFGHVFKYQWELRYQNFRQYNSEVFYVIKLLDQSSAIQRAFKKL